MCKQKLFKYLWKQNTSMTFKQNLCLPDLRKTVSPADLMTTLWRKKFLEKKIISNDKTALSEKVTDFFQNQQQPPIGPTTVYIMTPNNNGCLMSEGHWIRRYHKLIRNGVLVNKSLMQWRHCEHFPTFSLPSWSIYMDGNNYISMTNPLEYCRLPVRGFNTHWFSG